MASGGSSDRAPSGSRSFDFGSDDVLCSYDDFASQEPSHGKRPDTSGKDFRESKTGRPLVNVYSQQEEYDKQDLIAAVEKCMKKYADNLLRFLEGISGRLSQLELYCYNLERSTGELRSDLNRDQGETDLKLESIEKHLQEVHRSVQILRDKQELADTQKELAKLQLVHKESSESAPSAPETKRHADTVDAPNQQLALALPQQITPAPVHQPAPSSLGLQQDPYAVSQGGAFYAQRNQMLNQTPQPQQHQQNPSLQPEQQYVARPQTQDLSRQAPQQQPHLANQPQPPSFPQYQQPWSQQSSQQSSQQFPQQVMQPQHGTLETQIRPEVQSAYVPYPSNQPAKALPETYASSMPMQVPYPPIRQLAGNRPTAETFGYGGPGSPVQLPPSHLNVQRQPQPQTSQSSFVPQMSKSGGYMGAAAHYPQQSNVQGYVVYGSDGNRTAHFLPGSSYPPTSMSSSVQSQQPTPGSSVPAHTGPLIIRNHPYRELIEKGVSMGYVRDHVLNVILRMEESGQPVDFNGLLDRLNAQTAGASQRGWSG